MRPAGKLVGWLFLHLPFVARLWFRSRGSDGPPAFRRLTVPLNQLKLGLVTTGGVHHSDQPAFLRKSASKIGDGTWRQLDLNRPREELRITHDWYDHTDAEKDLNLVLPVDRVRELAAEGLLGALEPVAAGVMGHVEGAAEEQLRENTAPELAALFLAQGVDAVLLVPA